MATLATAKFDASDSEGDEDFVPSEATAPKKRTKQGSKRKAAGVNATAGPSKRSKPASGAEGDDAEEASATDSGSSDDEEDEGEGLHGGTAEIDAEAAKLRAEAEEAAAEERRRKARETFLSFQQIGDASSDRQDASAPAAPPVRMVDVQRARVFAGETIYETVLLPETDPEAIAFFAKQKEGDAAAPSGPPTASSSAAPAAVSTEPQASTTAPTGPAPPSVSSAVAEAPESSAPPISATSSAPAPKPVVKGGPPRRKPRQSLEAMASALGKGKKMTTLEKSQHDWNAHLAGSQAEKDELEANRRSGGFLEKRDFLDRVGDRRSQAFEQNGKR